MLRITADQNEGYTQVEICGYEKNEEKFLSLIDLTIELAYALCAFRNRIMKFAEDEEERVYIDVLIDASITTYHKLKDEFIGEEVSK